MIVGLNTGVSGPTLLNTSTERLAFVAGALVIITVYVCVVTPSCAVTTVVKVFGPTFKLIAPDALPEGTAIPFTAIVAVGSAAIGVTVTEVVALTTFAV